MTINERIELGVTPAGRTYVRLHFDCEQSIALLDQPVYKQVELLRAVVKEAVAAALAAENVGNDSSESGHG